VGKEGQDGRLLLAWDAFMVVMALASVGLVFYYDAVSDAGLRHAILLADWAFVGIFAADFVWDLARSDDKRRFLKRNWWAPLGMVPLALSELSAFRILRLFRVLRALRAFRALAEFFSSVQKAFANAQIARLGLISGTIMLVGSVLVWLAERGSNPGLAAYKEALWWAIVTVTTVGYGDVTPRTDLGRVIASGLMITGIGTIGLLAGQVGAGLIGKLDTEPGEEGATMPVRAGSVAEQLARLAELHKEGRLSDEEFSKAKTMVLREP
jgi:voltage-gated potassium channel